MDLFLVLFLALADEPSSAKAAEGKPSMAAAQAADSDRPPIASSEIKALRDSNIFAPYGRKNPPSKPSKGTERTKHDTPPAPKPKAPVVTGIFFDEKQKCYLVVVEDRNEASLRQFKDPKFLKSGEEVVGLKVGEITAEKAAFLKGDIARLLSVGEALPAEMKAAASSSSSSPSPEDPEAAPSDGAAGKVEGEEKVDIKPLDSEEKSKVLEKMKKERGKKNRPNQDDQ